MKHRSGEPPEILKKGGPHEKSEKAKRKKEKDRLKKEKTDDYR